MMNKSELNVWIKYHAANFADWNSWFGSKKTDGTPVQTAERGIRFESMAKALLRTDLPDAKAATDAMVAGDCRKPYLPEDHVAAAAREAAAIKRTRRGPDLYVDGQRVAKCRYCDDRGLVCIDDPQDPRGTSAVVCSCEAGQRKGDKMPDIRVFDPQVDHANC